MTTALAHRALAAAALYGLAPRGRRPVVAQAPSCAGVQNADLVVLVDTPPLDAAALAEAHAATARAGVVAIVVASAAAVGLVHVAPASTSRVEGARADAYARAIAWARGALRAPIAPPVSAARLRELVAIAASAGLVLVEPEVPRLSIQARTATERAVLATIALGATARPLLFVRAEHAPKNGLLRQVREERVLDGWIERHAEDRRTAPAASLLDAALLVLEEASAPVRGKDLLREARERWSTAADARGQRVSASSADTPALAKGLVAAWIDGTIELFATDPAEPLDAP